MKFVCENCGYSFETEAAKDTKKCPYCGEFSIVIEKSAEDLIKDSILNKEIKEEKEKN